MVRTTMALNAKTSQGRIKDAGFLKSAGPFGDWLDAMQAVLRGEQVADVPCGDCVGCCVSSYPIPLRPGDRVALARVPTHLLSVAAEQLPGHAMMGYRTDGTCPMHGAQGCTIYADRPQTCRDYDCRIFAAAGLLPDGERPIIRERVQQWEFSHPEPHDKRAATAMRRAAQFIRNQSEQFPPSMRTHSAMAAAVIAVKTWQLFADDRVPLVDQIVRAVRDFDA